MLFSAMFTLLLLFQICNFDVSLAKEPMCSKFAYEEQLLEKMIRTEIKVETMEKEIRKTQETVSDTLNEIKDTVVKITDKFEELKNNITQEMGKKTEQFRNAEELLKNSFDEQRTNITNDIDDQMKTLNELQGKMTQPSVAFYAHHVTDTILDTMDEIKFDSIITNEGSGYDTSTGIFTAPLGGTYQFFVHICTYVGKYSCIGLVLAGDLIAKTVNNSEQSVHTCNSVGAIVKVKSGEQVWVKSMLSNSNGRLIEDSYRMNTFSGILLDSRK